MFRVFSGVCCSLAALIAVSAVSQVSAMNYLARKHGTRTAENMMVAKKVFDNLENGNVASGNRNYLHDTLSTSLSEDDEVWNECEKIWARGFDGVMLLDAPGVSNTRYTACNDAEKVVVYAAQKPVIDDMTEIRQLLLERKAVAKAKWTDLYNHLDTFVQAAKTNHDGSGTIRAEATSDQASISNLQWIVDTDHKALPKGTVNVPAAGMEALTNADSPLEVARALYRASLKPGAAPAYALGTDDNIIFCRRPVAAQTVVEMKCLDTLGGQAFAKHDQDALSDLQTYALVLHFLGKSE